MRSMPANTIELKSKNQEYEGKIFLSPEMVEKKETQTYKPIILNTVVIPK